MNKTKRGISISIVTPLFFAKKEREVFRLTFKTIHSFSSFDTLILTRNVMLVNYILLYFAKKFFTVPIVI